MELTEIRAALARGGTAGRGRPYAPEVREHVRVYVLAARARGQSWTSLGVDLGVRPETLQQWVQAKKRDRSPQLQPVVAVQPKATLRIRVASGAVLEGLDLDAAVRVLRALG